MTQPRLETDRLLLRPIEEGDLLPLHAFWTEPEVRRYLWEGRILSLETVDQIIESSRDTFKREGYGLFGLALKQDVQQLIGFCGNRLFEEGHQIELLYGIHPHQWGRGLGSEAAREVLRYDFEQCGLEHIVAATDTPNQRSVKVLQRLGMSFQERREWHGLDTVFYSISKQEFQQMSEGNWAI